MFTRLRSFLKRAYSQPACLEIEGRFKTVNGAVPTVVVGRGFTVARTAEGKWTITLVDDDGTTLTYPELITATGSAMLASAAADAGDLTVHFDPIAADTEFSSVVVYLSQDGTDADTPDAWVQFRLLIRATQQET